VGELFKRYGLIQPRKRVAPRVTQGSALSNPSAPNALWSVDFKGQFRLGNDSWCYPLTLSDYATRYLLKCRGLRHPSEQAVWPYMERSFREYGLPEAIRSDNGAPFASVALGGLTRLAIWWLKLGIRLERICPGHPEQNPRHERMHRTLKADIDAPRHSLRAQQRRFDWFEHYYNVQRPHDALGGVPPSYRYVPSVRAYPARIVQPEYGASFVVRRVRSNGQIKWQGHLIFISEALIGEPIGLLPLEDDRWQLWFCTMQLGVLDMRTKKIERPG
jgi:putative transposase